MSAAQSCLDGGSNMKKLICIALCAAALCGSAVPVLALGDDIDNENTFYNDDLDGTDDQKNPPNPADPGGETSGSAGESPSGDSGSGTPDPKPDPKPDPTPAGITVDPNTQAVIVDLTKMKSIAFSGNTAAFTGTDGKTITHGTEANPLNMAGYRLTGLQGGAAISVSGNFAAPLTIGTASQPPAVYALTGDISAAALTVNGNLTLLKDTTFSGSVTVNGIINGSNSKTNLNGNLAATQLMNTSDMTVTGGASNIANLSAGTLTVSGGSLAATDIGVTGHINVTGGQLSAAGTVTAAGNISLTAPAGNAPAVTAKWLKAGGTLSISSNVSANAVTADGNVSISGTLTLKRVDNTYAGQLVSGGQLDVTGTVLADGVVEAKNKLNNSGTISAGGLQTQNGDIAAGGNIIANTVSTISGGNISVTGRLTNNSALNCAGTLTVASGAALDGGGTIKAASYSLQGAVKGKDLTAQKDLTLANSTALTGTLSAPNLTINGAVSAGTVSVPGTVTVDTKNRSAASLNANHISTGKLYATGGLSIPGATLDVKSGGVDVRGAFRARGGTVTGPLTADSIAIDGDLTAKDIKAGLGNISLSGTVNAASVNAPSGGVSARALTLTGPLRAYNDISLTGPFRGTSITSDYGSVVTGSSAPINQASTVDAARGKVSLGSTASLSGRVTGKNGVTMNGGSCGSISSDGAVNLKGTLRTGSINGGSLTVSGAVTASSVRCSSGTVDAKASLNCDSVNASSKLTVRGSITADSVRGNPVTAPSGGAIHADSVNGMDNGYKGKLTVTTPFGANKSIYVELKRSGENANGFHVTTDKNGKVTFSALASGTYSVYAESGSTARRGTVSVSSSGTSTLDLRSSAGGNNNGGNGGSNFFDEDQFWEDVYSDIRSARRGDTVRISASKADSVPTWILKELQGRPITLKLTHGRDSVTIDGDNMYDIPNNRVFYQFDDLADLYKFPPSASSSSNSSSSSSSSASSSVSSGSASQATPLPNPTPAPAPAPVPAPQPVTPPAVVTPSQDPEESSSEEEGSSQDEEPEEPEDPEEPEAPSEPEEPDVPAEKESGVNMLPIAVAIVLILVSLGGIAVGYVLYRRSRDNDSIYDDDDDD